MGSLHTRVLYKTLGTTASEGGWRAAYRQENEFVIVLNQVVQGPLRRVAFKHVTPINVNTKVANLITV